MRRVSFGHLKQREVACAGAGCLSVCCGVSSDERTAIRWLPHRLAKAMIEIVFDGGRFFLALVMLVAGMSKLRGFSEFRNLLESLTVLPRAVRGIALVVPVLELAAVPLLVFSPRVGATLVLGLLIAFASVIWKLLASGTKLTCGCFGSFSDAAIGRGTLLRNAGLGAICVGVVVSPPRLAAASLPNALTAIAIAATIALLLRTARDALRSREEVLESVTE